jgi:hypothetical protein
VPYGRRGIVVAAQPLDARYGPVDHASQIRAMIGNAIIA